MLLMMTDSVFVKLFTENKYPYQDTIGSYSHRKSTLIMDNYFLAMALLRSQTSV